MGDTVFPRGPLRWEPDAASIDLPPPPYWLLGVLWAAAIVTAVAIGLIIR